MTEFKPGVANAPKLEKYAPRSAALTPLLIPETYSLRDGGDGDPRLSGRMEMAMRD